MPTARSPVIRSTRATLADGSRIVMRLVRPDDARYADAFFRWLSDETKYLRFMYAVKELSPDMVASALAQDGLKRVVLVAEPEQHPASDPTPAVAIGRYAPSPDPAACEVAITVGDPWQGRGVGRALLRRLIALAKRAGYRSMCATALTTNTKMIGLARAFGFEIHAEPAGVTTMRKSLA
jgi:acetyltransferase